MILNNDEKGRTLYYVAADLILQKNNEVLLQRRANTGWCDGKWNLVGGHVDNDETLIECIIREAKEEIGITISKKTLKLFIAYNINLTDYHCNFILSAQNGKARQLFNQNLKMAKKFLKQIR